MNIAIIGTGYVGLVTGTCFAEMGNHVICVDIDESKVEKMKRGEIPIYEPDLDVLFERNTAQGRLFFTTDLKAAVKQSSIVFLALPTPSDEDGSADLKYVLDVADQLGDLIESYTIVVDKSTVPVGTAEKVAAKIGAKIDKDLFDVVSNPEFLREGVAVDDFLKPDRVVIGVDNEKAASVMKRLYSPFVRQGNPIIIMDIRSAEMTKYAANAYLATRITFMNEIANICEKLGANVDNVRRGMGSDTRIGKRFLFPGVGYGGSCFPKDVKALIHTSNENGYNFRLLNEVTKVNEFQKEVLVKKINNYFKGEVEGKKIAIWGLSFKPETDDIREAPAIKIIRSLLEKGAIISAYDPEAMPNMKAIFGDQVEFAKNEYDAIDDADALAIITEWSIFRTPNFADMKSRMKNPLIFDGRNLYQAEFMVNSGFYYESIGRTPVQLEKKI